MQEDDPVLVLDRGYVHVGRGSVGFSKARQFEIMCGEQRITLIALDQVFCNRNRQRQPVEGGRSAADLVHQHQAVAAGVVQYVGSLRHLDHERRLAARQIVGSADARKDAIDPRQRNACCRHETADVGK